MPSVMLRKLALALFLTLGTVGRLPGQEQPSVDRSRLGFGLSPSVSRHSWAYLGCRLQNPDLRPREVALRLLSNNAARLGQGTVLTRCVRLPAQAELEYRCPVLIEDQDEYRLDFFVDGERVSEAQAARAMSVRLIPDRTERLLIVNDAPDLSLGAVAAIKEFAERWHTAQFRAVDLPSSPELYRKIHAVVLVVPDFSACGARQLEALRQYVLSGGRLVIVHPQGIWALAGTPLADLLPVAPMRWRQVADLMALRRHAPDFKGWVEERHPVLECESVGDGVTLLAEGDLPLVRWSRRGLGEVRVATFPVTEATLAQTGAFREMLRLMLHAPLLHDDPSRAEAVLDEMTGFTVPKPGTVRNLLLVYFLLVAVVMGVGLARRRVVQAWLAAALLGVVVAGLILRQAARGGQEASPILAGMEVAAAGRVDGCYSLFSPVDQEVSVAARDDSVRFRAIPPPDSSFRFAGSDGLLGGESLGDPLEAMVRNGRAELDRLTLRTNVARHFAASGQEALADGLQGGLAPPELTVGGEELALTPWPLPEGRHPQLAWLLLPAGVLPLRVEAGTLVLPPGPATFQADEIAHAIEQALRLDLRREHPCLVWLEEADEALLPLPPAEMRLRGRRLTLVPVVERLVDAGGKFVVQPEQIVLSAADSATRIQMAGNEIRRESTASLQFEELNLRFHLPAVYAGLRAGRVELEFEYVNSGGNLIVTPVLLPDPGPGLPLPSAEREVAGQCLAPGRYAFGEVAGALSPVEGTGLLRLKFSSRAEVMDSTQRMRANSCQITRLRLRVFGILPAGLSGARF